MAGASAIKAGEAYIRLFADDTALRRGLDAAARRLRTFGLGLTAAGAGLAAIGAGTLTGLFAAADAFSTTGDAIDKMNKRTGLSTEFISEMGFVAEQSGTNIEELEKGFRKFQQTLGDADKGSKMAVDSIESIGLSVDGLMAMSPDEQFYAIAAAIAAIEDPALQTEAAMGLLGKTGAQLIPLIKEGVVGMTKLREQARELGLTFDADAAASAARVNDALGALTTSLKTLWVWIGSALAPAISELAETVAPVIGSIIQWVKENRELVVMVAQAAVAVTALGVALIGIGGVAIFAGLTLGGLSTIIGAVGAGLALLIGFLGSTGGMLSIIAAGAAVVGAHFVDLSGTIEWLAQQFRILGSIASETFGGIADALAYGDIELAAQILWAGLQAAWKVGVNALNEAWLTVKTFILTKAHEIWAGVQIVWDDLSWGLVDAIYGAIHLIENAWTRLSAFMKKTWQSTTGVVADLMIDVMGVFDPDLDVEEAKKIRRENDARTTQGIDAGRDETLRVNNEQWENLRREMNSRRKGEHDRILADLAAAEKKLAGANEESRKAAEAELALAQAKLDTLREEARLQRYLHDEEKRRQKTAESVGSEVKTMQNTDQVGFLSGSRRALEGFRPDLIRGPLERVAKAAEETADNTGDLVSAMNSMRNGLAWA